MTGIVLWRCRRCGKWSTAQKRPKKHVRYENDEALDEDWLPDDNITWIPAGMEPETGAPEYTAKFYCGPFDRYVARLEDPDPPESRSWPPPPHVARWGAFEPEESEPAPYENPETPEIPMDEQPCVFHYHRDRTKMILLACDTRDREMAADAVVREAEKIIYNAGQWEESMMRMRTRYYSAMLIGRRW